MAAVTSHVPQEYLKKSMATTSVQNIQNILWLTSLKDYATSLNAPNLMNSLQLEIFTRGVSTNVVAMVAVHDKTSLKFTIMLHT